MNINTIFLRQWCRWLFAAIFVSWFVTLGSIPNSAAADEENELNFTVEVPVGIAQAFEMWISPAWASQFLAIEVKIDARVGGRYEALFDPENDPAGAHAGTYGSKIREIKPMTQLMFEWNYFTPRLAAEALGGQRLYQETLVDVRFEQISEQCTSIHIRHFGLANHEHGTASYEYYRDYGWPWIINRLKGIFKSEEFDACS